MFKNKSLDVVHDILFHLKTVTFNEKKQIQVLQNDKLNLLYFNNLFHIVFPKMTIEASISQLWYRTRICVQIILKTKNRVRYTVKTVKYMQFCRYLKTITFLMEKCTYMHSNKKVLYDRSANKFKCYDYFREGTYISLTEMFQLF